ncbi:MAG: hypothetical protein E7062_08910 [Spirochaetaceae bacterium]|nr:hypothetical protein [Spirochaetaceae bacterium]
MTTMIIAGKDFPEVSPYMTTAINNERNVSITIPNTDCLIPESDNIITVKWNKVSSLSAKTFVVQTENQFNSINEALIIFDAKDFSGKFDEMSPENITQVLDELFFSYLQLTREILKRFQKKGNGHFIFLLKGLPSLAEEIKITSGKAELGTEKNSLLVALAQQNFITLAENIAATLYNFPHIKVSLLKSELTNETDESISQWLFSFLSSSQDYAKDKTSLLWTKTGSKPRIAFFNR